MCWLTRRLQRVIAICEDERGAPHEQAVASLASISLATG